MAETIQSINDKLDALTTSVESGFVTIQTEIDDLKAQIAAGSPVSQEDLDKLGAKVDSISADVLGKEAAVK